MKNIYTIINQKGGVGKSTTAFALGAGLSMKGFKTLFVDLDAQANLTHSIGIRTGADTAFEVLDGSVPVKDAIIHGEKWDYVPSGLGLAGADLTLNKTGKEFRLKEALEQVADDYDYIVVDTPPALGILTINALTASTGVIVPSQADIYSLLGIGQLHVTAAAVKKYCNPALSIKGILLTRYNGRSILSRDVSDMIGQTAKQLDTIVYKTTIREAVAIKEAQARQQDIYSYASKSAVTADYREFVKEVLGYE